MLKIWIKRYYFPIIFIFSIALIGIVSSRLMLVKSVTIIGNNNLSEGVIKEALGNLRGERLFSLSLSSMKSRIESLGWVYKAVIRRSFSGVIKIEIEERKPYILWSDNLGKIYLSDKQGQIIKSVKRSSYPELMLIRGEGSRFFAASIKEILDSHPLSDRQIVLLSRIGDRRWDIHLRSGILIMLPEQGFKSAWKKLVAADRKYNILDRKITRIDLRNDRRVVVSSKPLSELEKAKELGI